jgi:hypothetical protein
MIRAGNAKMQLDRGFAWVPRAPLERATYCLGGTLPTSPDVARCRLTSAPAAAKIAGRRLTSPYAGGRWLPVWLPRISLATLTSE